MTVSLHTRPVALLGSTDSETDILRKFAEFWKIPYTSEVSTAALPTVYAGNHAPNNPNQIPTVLIPTSREVANKIAENNQVHCTTRRTRMSIPSSTENDVSIETEGYAFSGQNLEPILQSGDFTILARIKGSKVHLLSVDLVGEYSKRIDRGFEESPSLKFRIATRLPFSYQTIPKFLRNRSFRAVDGTDALTSENLGPVEFLRTLFLASIVLSSGPVPRIRLWGHGKSYSMAVTHDVETQYGLEEGAVRLLKVESQLGIRSTWNIPSNRYPITDRALRKLAESGEIGGHDTKHDGRLVLLNEEEKVERLRRCKQSLEKMTDQRVRGFRAPLLQHSPELASAESMAGFEYDSSCPSWEILSPTSLKAHGVGTLFPFKYKGILEIPVSLPQDHQLLRVAGKPPSVAVDFLLHLSKWIRGLGGACILLVHPDYELSLDENVADYKRLLENFASDPQCQIMTMGELADWWKYRESATWEITNDDATIVTSDQGRVSELQPELVTSYGENGFTTEALF